MDQEKFDCRCLHGYLGVLGNRRVREAIVNAYANPVEFLYPLLKEIMMNIKICLLGLILATPALAQNPIPRQGNSCPTGTYKSGDYCKPFKSSEDQVIIQKSGKDCPTGFYKSGNYCKRMSSSDREALHREDGSDCPTGWYKSGRYCMKQ